MEGQLRATIPPPAASQNAAPIIPGPGQYKSLQDRANKSSLVGTIAYLGHESVHPANCWVRESQPHQLAMGAFNHPVLILAKQGNLVFCAPCTSWHGQTPQEKWSKSPQALDDALHSHMELLSTTEPADCATMALGGLKHSGRRMEKRTFVSLQRGFWTEAHLLEEWTKGGARQLTGESSGIACWAYTTAYNWRQLNGISEEFQGSSKTLSLETWRPVQRGDGVSKSVDDSTRRNMASKGGVYKPGAMGRWPATGGEGSWRRAVVA